MIRLTRTLLVTVCALSAWAGPAHGATMADDGLEVIDDAEMDDLRGGFNIGGIEVGFGAVVTSTLNGVPVLTTQLTLTDTGAILQQTLLAIGASLESLTPEQREALGLKGLEGGAGVVIGSESGITAFVHNVANGSLQNILVNTATGQDIEQHIDVTLTLPGFEYIQNQLRLEQLGMHISDDLQSVAIGRYN